MTEQQIRDNGTKCLESLGNDLIERGYSLAKLCGTKQIVLLAGELLPKDIHPLIALWVLDVLLEDGRGLEAVLLQADEYDNHDRYIHLVRHIRRLALRKHSLDVHCGASGLEVREVSKQETEQLLGDMREEIKRECACNTLKLFPLP